MMTDLRATAVIPQPTALELRAYLDALPADDWTPLDDLRLVEGLVAGDPLAALARDMALPLATVVARWFALTRPIAATTGHRAVTPDGQAMLIRELRGRL